MALSKHHNLEEYLITRSTEDQIVYDVGDT